MGGNKLECNFVQVDDVLEILSAFVVQNVQFGDNPSGSGPELSWSIRVW
jgi:hypothetical protein